MMLPGLISLAFYRRWPSRLEIALGLVSTVGLCALLGYYSPAGSLGRDGSILLAVVGGVLLYSAILGYLYLRHRARGTTSAAGSALPPD